MINIKVFEGKNKNVKKYVFTKKDAVYEAVVYKYGSYMERTVICCSVQSGCPVGCVFCGTGKRFVRNLTTEEIKKQISDVLTREDIIDKTEHIQKFQIMFMSMGEPMLNWFNVKQTIIDLHAQFPNAQLLLSTVGIHNDDVFKDIVNLATEIDKIGLQFSLHNTIDEERSRIIPYKNKYTIREIRERGLYFFSQTGRKPYLNYCVTAENCTEKHVNRFLDLFTPQAFCITLSTICNTDKSDSVDKTDWNGLYHMQNELLNTGFNIRIFDPAGKDDIGGGCGQLWYVQDWLKRYKKPLSNSIPHSQSGN